MSDDVKAENPKGVRIGGELFFARRNRFTSRSEVYSIPCAYAEGRARMAIVLIEKWGMVAAVPDGEDSAGRARLRLMLPSEIVGRACETADLAYSVFESYGWIHDVPDEILLGFEPEE
jgi:hypothetical protein